MSAGKSLAAVIPISTELAADLGLISPPGPRFAALDRRARLAIRWQDTCERGRTRLALAIAPWLAP